MIHETFRHEHHSIIEYDFQRPPVNPRVNGNIVPNAFKLAHNEGQANGSEDTWVLIPNGASGNQGKFTDHRWIIEKVLRGGPHELYSISVNRWGCILFIDEWKAYWW